MAEPKPFNPIESAKRIEDSYRGYLATTIHFADPGLQRQLEGILNERGYLAKGPFVEAAPPYVKGPTPRELVESGELCHSILKLGNGDPSRFDPDRPLYAHQARAIRKANAGHNFAVVTGTGSGKTECFLLPILNDILSELEQGKAPAGVRALILYPMNALANDQLKRLRELLEGTEVTFGRYTGDTAETEVKAVNRWREENPGSKRLPNELISREEIRRNPPHILLTNYSMLEYLLLRPADAPLFGNVFGARWRHIAIDEAHVYTGALGTEIAFLLRRLKARITSETGSAPELRCYATSATIGTDSDTPKVARFAQDLFGEPFSQEGDIDVITSEKDWPENYLRVPWGSLPLGLWPRLREMMLADVVDARAIVSLVGPYVPNEELDPLMREDDVLVGVGTLLLGEESSATLVRATSSDVIDLTSLDAIDGLGIEGLTGDSEGVETLAAMVDVLSVAERSPGVPILSSRYHSFLRAPEGLYINLLRHRLIAHKTCEEDMGYPEPVPVYEVSVCRHCGQAYILGNKEDGTVDRPTWLNPRYDGIDTDEDVPPRTYYRILDDEDDVDEAETVAWLCPVCGSLHGAREGGGHVFSHDAMERVPIGFIDNGPGGRTRDEDDARCTHCGYQNRYAIQPMRVSPEAAGSVVCYDLVRDVPPFASAEDDPDDLFAFATKEERRAGSVICFSDRRQDAAFFAPSMERTYGTITRRQVMREAIEACSTAGRGCRPTDVVAWIAHEGPYRYPGLFEDDVNNEDQAMAWVMDEIEAEDSRNSLDGLGVARIVPTAFIEGLENANVRKALDVTVSKRLDKGKYPWLTTDDLALFATVCLDTLRERGAIKVDSGAAQLRQRARGLSLDRIPPRMCGIEVTVGGTEADRGTLQFAGSPHVTENKRSRFVRRYAREFYDVELTREEAIEILSALFEFIRTYLNAFRQLRLSSDNVIHGKGGKFVLGRDLWTMYPGSPKDTMYVCDTCGCATHLYTRGICTTSRCAGHMEETTFKDALDKDRFYKEVYGEEALPIRIEEHTAQLSIQQARTIQGDFIKGDVNVLSCTTTFELGVDVGDLRCVFMRNVPPSTANYTQRAGRVGRRAGMPGFAVTFARLRPHDYTFFEDPAQMITGATRVPACYLDNEQIARRHVYAVALSEYFRTAGNEEMAQTYSKFLSLGKEDPPGVEELEEYLKDMPARIGVQLSSVFGDLGRLSERMGIADGSWVEGLLAAGDNQTGEGMGRLRWVHGIKYQDYQRVNDAIKLAESSGDSHRAASFMHTRGVLEKELTINVLADGGVLPKYGFPTDLVELHLMEASADTGDGRLRLQRGMQQAIREYAPGAEVVAGKQLWKSIGIRSLRGREPIVRSFGECPECKTFAWPIDNSESEYECPVCGHTFTLKDRLLVPSGGFEGARQRRGVGERRPRARGYARVYFSQHWPAEAPTYTVAFSGGDVICKYANNGELCLVNSAGGKGFRVCHHCGAAVSDKGEKIQHLYFCKKTIENPRIDYYRALGASFTSDILELSLRVNDLGFEEDEAWESVMWALVAAASRILEVPETEIGGTTYRSDGSARAVMLYDTVPGGAGHAKQLSEDVGLLMSTAYEIVATCTCGEETCCYGCIANYYNQGKQSKLSRGAAKRILGMLLGKGDGDEGGGEARLPDEQEVLVGEFAVSLAGVDFATACAYGIRLCRGEDERLFVERLAALGKGEDLERPECEVTFSNAAGDEADVLLAWEDARVIVLGAAALEDFEEAGFERRPHGWRTFIIGEDEPADVISALAEGNEV